MDYRNIYGILDPDGVHIHVISFHAKHCKEEFARLWDIPNKSYEDIWEEAKGYGFRCVDLGLAKKGSGKYRVHKEAVDPWDVVEELEEELEGYK